MRASTYRLTQSGGHAQQTSSGTADVKSMTAPADAQAVILTVETTGCYVTFDGSAPSSTNGLFLPTGVVMQFAIAAGMTLKFASSAAAASKVNAAWLG